MALDGCSHVLRLSPTARDTVIGVAALGIHKPEVRP
jgi:hypothetical protein